MLQFFTRSEVILPGGDFRFLTNAVPAAEGGQSGIGDLGSTANQFLMDPDEIAFVTGKQFQNLDAVGLGFLWTDQDRQRRGL